MTHTCELGPSSVCVFVCVSMRVRLFLTLVGLFFTLQEILQAVGRGLGPLNRANKIWCYGFGDINTRDDSVFCFMPNDEPCQNLDQVRHLACCVLPVQTSLFQRGSLCSCVFSSSTLEYVKLGCYNTNRRLLPKYTCYPENTPTAITHESNWAEILVCKKRLHTTHPKLGGRTRVLRIVFVRRWRIVSRCNVEQSRAYVIIQGMTVSPSCADSRGHPLQLAG